MEVIRKPIRNQLIGMPNITFALLIAFFRGTYIDFWGVVLCVALMSISGLFYIVGVEYEQVGY